jgi:hypothetical protein
MNFLQDEQRRLDAENLGYALALGKDPKYLGLPIPRKPAQSIKPTPPPPPVGTEQFCRVVPMPCDGCGGSGRSEVNWDADPWDAPPCEVCGGTTVQLIARNYLSEALAIAANPDSTRPVEREHLICLLIWARQFVSASLMLPDVELPPEVAA